jgi:hypothetical protein
MYQLNYKGIKKANHCTFLKLGHPDLFEDGHFFLFQRETNRGVI